MEGKQKEKQLIFMKAANQYFELMDLVVCSSCYRIVHNGNYCEQCGSKLTPIKCFND